MSYFSAIKKSEILPFATTWVDLEGIMLSKISQRKTNTDDFTNMWNLINKIKQRQINRYGEQISGYQRRRHLWCG